MTNAVATATLISQTFPVGTTSGDILFELLDSTSAVTANQSVTAGATDPAATATFANVTPGTYTVRSTRQDAGGAALGSPVVSAPFTVSAPSSVTVTVPSGISVDLQ